MKKFLIMILVSIHSYSLAVEDTPLMIAAEGEGPRANFCQVVDLVKKGADVNKPGAGGFTALMKACLGGFLNVVEYLIANGADVNIQENTSNGDSALLKIINRNWLSLKKEDPGAEKKATGIVKMLLEAGADPNLANKAGQTPLMWAAAYDLRNIIDLLLKYGANDQIIAKDGRTVKDVAMPDAMDFIQKKQQELFQQFQEAILLGNFESIKQLVSVGAKVNQVFSKPGFKGVFSVPIILAAQEGDLSLVNFLISKGADVNVQEDVEGETALFKAVRGSATQPSKKQEYYEIAKALLNAKANLNTANAHGMTPLMIAAAADLYNIMKLLLDYKAKKKLKNQLGETAADLASEKGKKVLRTYKIKRKK